MTSDLSKEIDALEREIERLSDAAERCRKIGIVAQAVIGAFGFVLVAVISGLLRFDPMIFIAAIAAVLGGIVLFGSNRSTKDRIKASIREHEARRVEMIDMALSDPERDFDNRIPGC